MGINPKQLRALYRDCGSSLNAYRLQLRHLLGLRYNERTEQFYVDRSNRQLATEEFSNFRKLSRELLGGEFCDEWESDTGPMPVTRAEVFQKAYSSHNQATASRLLHESFERGSFVDFSMAQTLQEGINKGLGKSHRLVTEDAAPLTPDIFQEINLYTSTVAGLLEVRILEGFRSVDFISENFVKVEPTRSNGGKIISVQNVSPAIQLWQPGLEFSNIDVKPLFAWAFENIIPGAKISLDKYAVLFDISGELMAKAENLGYGLGYILEYYRLAHTMGISSITSSVLDPSVTAQIQNRFLLNDPNGSGTPNATYQTSGNTNNTRLPNGYNFANQQTQSFTDWTSLQQAQNLLNLMRDPVNNLPIQGHIKEVLVDPSQWQLALYVKHMTMVTDVTGTPATSYNGIPFQGSNSTVPPVLTQSPGRTPLQEIMDWTPYKSNIAHQIWLDAGVSEANAKKRWLAGDFKRAFRWRQLQDLLTQSANPTSADLLSKNIVGLWTGQWAGQMVVENPRAVILNTE